MLSNGTTTVTLGATQSFLVPSHKLSGRPASFRQQQSSNELEEPCPRWSSFATSDERGRDEWSKELCCGMSQTIFRTGTSNSTQSGTASQIWCRDAATAIRRINPDDDHRSWWSLLLRLRFSPAHSAAMECWSLWTRSVFMASHSIGITGN